MNNTAEACKNILTCPICMDRFATPKILTCGHSLCLAPCLAEMVKEPDPVCPLCRTLIVFPPSGKIEDMITNYSVRSLIEALEKTYHSDGTSSDISCLTEEHVEENPSKTKISRTLEACKEVLTYPICIDTFTTPKILTCGHSICLAPCLSKIAQLIDQVCPLCRSSIVLPPSGKIEDMVTNFSVKSLIETLEKIDQKHRTSSDVPCHTQEYGDYICMTCLQQICSCCQLSFHIDANHECISILKFRENLVQDVSKMNAEVNELRWLEQTQRYTTVFAEMSIYFDLKVKINNACEDILQSSNEKHLGLKNIKQIRKKIKNDHAKFREVIKVIAAKIKDAIEMHLTEYRQKLIGITCPENVKTRNSFSLETFSFENLKLETDAKIEFVTKQMEIESFCFRNTEDEFQNISKNIRELEHYVKVITQKFHNSLLQEIGVTDVVEPHHLFRVKEVVDMMNFRSNRHSKDVMLKCNESILKFQASKDFVKTSSENLLKTFHNQPFPPTKAEGKIIKTLEEVENCRLYYETVYEFIEKHFVFINTNSMKHHIKYQLMVRNNSYVLQSTPKGKIQIVKDHLYKFETFKQSTEKECEALIRYLSNTDLTPERSVVHKKLKTIELRLEQTEYHFRLVSSLVNKELTCHQLAKEFKRFFPAEQKRTAKLTGNYVYFEEVQRLWKEIKEHEPTAISFDLLFITNISKSMEQSRKSLVSKLMPSKKRFEILHLEISYIRQIMDLRSRLRNEVPEISNKMPDTYNRHQQELNKLNLSSKIVNCDSFVSLESFSLQKLATLLHQADSFRPLSNQIRNAFADECKIVDQTTSRTQTNFVVKYGHRWVLLNQVKVLQWNKLINYITTYDHNIDALRTQFDRAMSLHYIIDQCIMEHRIKGHHIRKYSFMERDMEKYSKESLQRDSNCSSCPVFINIVFFTILMLVCVVAEKYLYHFTT